MLKNIIFDFDGVIADTFDMNLALSQEHHEGATLEDFLAHHDGNVYEEPRIMFKPERLGEFYAAYDSTLSESHLAMAMGPIQRLGKKYALYIISSNSEVSIRRVLEKAGVAGLFTRIMGEEMHRSKVEKFKILIEQNGITPDNSIFITDTLGDVKEANKVNIKTIAETFGYHDRARLAQGNPFKIADSWDEIEQVLHDLG